MIEFKKCNKCSISFVKSTEFFYRNKDTEDGLQGQCKGCVDKLVEKSKNVRYGIAKKATSHFDGSSEKHAYGKKISSNKNGDPVQVSTHNYLLDKQLQKQDKEPAQESTKQTNKLIERAQAIAERNHHSTDLLAPQRTPMVFWFGKYEGKPVSTIEDEDPDYIRWCIRNVPSFKHKYMNRK